VSEIVVGYDGSDSSKAALSHALEFAKALGDSVVIVFGDAPGGYGGGEVPEQKQAVDEFARKVTQEALDAAQSAKVESAVELVNEHAHEALITVAKRHDARMIVVGSHGESPLKGTIVGSTAYKLLHFSETPVLVVRPR
jgi:nucleotide-binding universal stress UspA family protein